MPQKGGGGSFQRRLSRAAKSGAEDGATQGVYLAAFAAALAVIGGFVALLKQGPRA